MKLGWGFGRGEGIGVRNVYFSGYTPYPTEQDDRRLPHIHQKLTKQIQKTALGAEHTQKWEHTDNVELTIQSLKNDGYTVLALEQTETSVPLHTYQQPDKIAILIGREVEGIDAELIKLADTAVEIPMYGNKESFNVVQATAMLLYHLRFN